MNFSRFTIRCTYLSIMKWIIRCIFYIDHFTFPNEYICLCYDEKQPCFHFELHYKITKLIQVCLSDADEFRIQNENRLHTHSVTHAINSSVRLESDKCNMKLKKIKISNDFCIFIFKWIFHLNIDIPEDTSLLKTEHFKMFFSTIKFN